MGDNNKRQRLIQDEDMPQEETRDRLLQAGVELFAEHGFKGVSLNKIGRAANTSSSSILHFFVNKEGLLKAICDRTWREVNDRVAKVLDPKDTALVKCEKALYAVLSYLENHPDEARLVLLESKQIDEQQKGPITGEQFRFKETLDAVLREGKKDGSFPHGLSITAAREGLLGLLEGMLFAKLLDRMFGYSTAKYAKKEIEDMVNRSIRGLAVSSSRMQRGK